jgi:hypothetical protein
LLGLPYGRQTRLAAFKQWDSGGPFRAQVAILDAHIAAQVLWIRRLLHRSPELLLSLLEDADAQEMANDMRALETQFHLVMIIAHSSAVDYLILFGRSVL